jgi:hypothetical protein
MKTRTPIISALIAGLALAAAPATAADGNLITNPGFEDPGVGGAPLGWSGFNTSSSDYVDANDIDAQVRTGDKSIRLRPATNDATRFQGWTTNIFLPNGSDLYDPDYTYLGGDVHVSGYYLVPEGETLANDLVALKLEFRREPPNFSIYTSFEFPVDVSETGGFWHYFEVTVTDEDMLAVGDFPPYATSVTILPLRFFGGAFASEAPTGTIYWDDLCYVQGDLPAGCNAADIAEPFDILDLADITAFIAAFTTMSPAADLDENGIYDLTDISLFITAFTGGCP